MKRILIDDTFAMDQHTTSSTSAARQDSSLLIRPLRALTRVVTRFPRATILLAIVVAIVAGLLAATQLGLRTSRLHLLNPNSGYNQLWLRYIDEFGDQDDVVIVVESGDPQQVVDGMEEIVAELDRRRGVFTDVLYQVDLSRMRAKGLYQLNPKQLRDVDQSLRSIERVLRGDWSILRASSRAAGLAEQLSDPDNRAAAVASSMTFVDNLQATVIDQPSTTANWPTLTGVADRLAEMRSKYLLTADGRTGLILLRLIDQQSSFAPGSEAITELREMLGRIDQRNAEVSIGLTGLPVMENDEMVASQSASWRASLLSLVGVACLFVAGFGGLRHPLLATLALLLAIVWSFGYVTLAVGHLNILSMAFGVILVGLGIDFGIHYVACYLDLRSSNDNSRDALLQATATVGPGIVAGGTTTALAFFAAGLTDFTGVAELGVIAGGGIILCVAATIGVLPAMIQLLDRHRDRRELPQLLNLGRCVSPLAHIPRLTLTASMVITVLLAAGLPKVWYDHNLLNLQPAGLESVDLERRLMANTDESVWFALSLTTDRDELLARKKQFESLTDTVDHTEEIVSLMPTDVESKRPLVANIAQRLATLPHQPSVIPVDEPSTLDSALGNLQSIAASLSDAGSLANQIERLRTSFRDLPAAEASRRIARYQSTAAAELSETAHRLRSFAETNPPDWSDLPSGLVARFVGRNQAHLLKVYAKADIWDMNALEAFVADVRRVDPQATGKPLQTFEASRQMQWSYVQAACYALIAVCMVLLLDFGRLQHVLLALVPVVFGMLQLFGILGLMGIPLNPANMIVLPLILGIGIDDGVHVIHDFRRQAGRFRLSRSTATAIVMTSLTTMIGFGSLMIASHRGLYSLGRVLTIGVGCCLITSLVTLPALLQWLTARRSRVEDQHAARPPQTPAPHLRRPQHVRDTVAQ